MKKLFFGLITLMLCVSLSAQNKVGNDAAPSLEQTQDAIKKRAERSTNFLAGRFELDEAQKAELMIIQTRVQKNYLEILPLRKSAPETFHEKQIALAKTADAEILKILNEEQKEKYNAMRSERNEQELKRSRKLQSSAQPE